MKRQADSFRPGQQVPSCCLSIEWTKDGNPIKLKHRISLVGAMEPFNFFYIKCIPDNPPIGIEGTAIVNASYVVTVHITGL